MRFWVVPFMLVLFLAMAACQPGDTNLMGDNQTGNQQSGDRTGQQDGQMNVTDRQGQMDRQGDRMGQQGNQMGTGTGTTDRNRGQDGMMRFDVAEEAADDVTDQVDEVSQAYVMTGDNNAYVAVVLHNNDNGTDDLSDEVKEEVADVVNSTKQDLNNVYVSANPDFFNMVNDYTQRVNEGDPIEGFFEEFNAMLDRVFPNLER
ncbi:YhcN/YlaJ family sporulation lipoprotein [Alkalibacillus haloalkaliphilus]|uniref:YhcN/YlaJ family sporulation lipoprotein n=1 Tax=Alkalibacillus haloalkaliphilus TaxID=94136 RepID=UPI0029355269|nr:YhcN/YlaJ family sporulation lipoprotein [Alkalibacillus haloalkaliphilus]MDV2582488.1 YhcN/YlaJ family sporulation lipoprotein [Alkalibacillus haloalkaliphilus]